jgi:hypothetical protein
MKSGSLLKKLFLLFLASISFAQVSLAQINILPLHTFELKVFYHSPEVNLEWVAENELNTSRFVIERSADGINYFSIAIKPVAGPPNTPTTYRYTDNISAISGKGVYYRIKAEDLGSKYAYTNVILVRLSNDSGIQAWPSLFTDRININYNAPATTTVLINLTDITGKQLKNNKYSVSRGLNQFTMNELGTLTPGIYFIRVIDNSTNEVFFDKLTKQ